MTDPSLPPDELVSMRPVKIRPARESLLPPRALPAAGSAATLIGGAVVAAYEIPDPTVRALVMLAAGVLTWAIGYFTPPPRRHFRRGDR